MPLKNAQRLFRFCIFEGGYLNLRYRLELRRIDVHAVARAERAA